MPFRWRLFTGNDEMIKLAVLADDFTGALDTAVQFSSKGAATMLFKPEALMEKSDLDCQVIAIDMQTRHLTRDDAYAVAYAIAKRVRIKGIPYLYVKTDSALRGNVGATLEAVVDAWEENVIFAPSYPDTGRLVRQGILTIEGIPASQSHFAQDLFNPVVHDSVYDMIAEQSTIPVVHEPCAERAIVLKNAESNEELETIAHQAVRSGSTLLAGCAGLARFLPDALRLSTGEIEMPEIDGPMVVISGSTSPVSVEQLRRGKEYGFESYVFRDILKEKADFTPIVQRVKRLKDELGLIIEVGCEADGGSCADSFEKKGKRIAHNLGKAAEKIVRSGFSGTLFVFGGDTLASVVRQLGATGIQPMGEIECGVVVSQIDISGQRIPLISKSGSFGSANVLEKICEQYMRREWIA